MKSGIIFVAVIIFACYKTSNAGEFRQIFKNGDCLSEQFRCLNNVCIQRNKYCNGQDDCGDNSDEKFCSTQNCPTDYPFFKCQASYYNSYICIPAAWKCDGVYDCKNHDDETDCGNVLKFKVLQARRRAIHWLHKQAKNQSVTNRWGSHVQRISIALYLGDLEFMNPQNITRKEIAYELSIQLLSKFAFKRLKDVSTFDLASYTNALLVTCMDPRKFHSVDLVRELRSRVNAQNSTNPYVLLTLCTAGETITKRDIEKLIEVFSNVHREFWTEVQALTVMALACAGRQPGSSLSMSKLKELTLELKTKQYRNGTVENLPTTALVMQALFASEPEEDENNFDEEKAILQILREQKDDGSFGSINNAYYVIPVLNYKSLLNISSEHCRPYIKDEETGFQDLISHVGPKMRIRYTLWIGDNKDLERSLKLRVPTNMSFYGVLETAGDIDFKYKFQYAVKNGKPYINALSGIQDDPESERFWFPFIFNGTKISPVSYSPADLILKDSDHVIMWYRYGSWIE